MVEANFEEKFSLNEMILEGIYYFDIDLDSLKDDYSFQSVGTIPNSEITELPESLIKKFQDYLKKPRPEFDGKSYWDISHDDSYAKKSNKGYNGNTKKFFTRKQVDDILFSSEIYDFLNQYSSNKKPSSQELLMEVAKQKINWNNAVKEALLPSDEYSPDFPSQEMLILEDIKLMVEGIFDIFYEPIDFKKLDDEKHYVNVNGGNKTNIKSILLTNRINEKSNYLIRRSLNDIKKRLENKD